MTRAGIPLCSLNTSVNLALVCVPSCMPDISHREVIEKGVQSKKLTAGLANGWRSSSMAASPRWRLWGEQDWLS